MERGTAHLWCFCVCGGNVMVVGVSTLCWLLFLWRAAWFGLPSVVLVWSFDCLLSAGAGGSEDDPLTFNLNLLHTLAQVQALLLGKEGNTRGL